MLKSDRPSAKTLLSSSSPAAAAAGESSELLTIVLLCSEFIEGGMVIETIRLHYGSKPACIQYDHRALGQRTTRIYRASDWGLQLIEEFPVKR